MRKERFEMDNEYIVKKWDCEVYSVKPGKGSWDWALFFVDENTGALSIQSSYGDFEYIWSCIGDKTLKEFLLGLNEEYLRKKITRGPDFGMEFDDKATLKAMRKEIEEDQEEWEHSRGKEFYTRLFEEFEGSEEEEFRDWFMNTTKVFQFFEGCPPVRYYKGGQWVGFYKNLWPLFMDVIEQEIRV